jgi:hypothetical protein
MKTHLRDSREFQKVYKTGERYEGSFLTAFVKANDCGFHRLGITASKKALGNAVRAQPSETSVAPKPFVVNASSLKASRRTNTIGC